MKLQNIIIVLSHLWDDLYLYGQTAAFWTHKLLWNAALVHTKIYCSAAALTL